MSQIVSTVRVEAACAKSWHTRAVQLGAAVHAPLLLISPSLYPITFNATYLQYSLHGFSLITRSSFLPSPQLFFLFNLEGWQSKHIMPTPQYIVCGTHTVVNYAEMTILSLSYHSNLLLAYAIMQWCFGGDIAAMSRRSNLWIAKEARWLNVQAKRYTRVRWLWMATSANKEDLNKIANCPCGSKLDSFKGHCSAHSGTYTLSLRISLWKSMKS